MMKHILTIFLLCLLTLSAGAQSVKELQKQRETTLKQLEKTGKMLSETKKSEKATQNKLELLGKDIVARRRLISDINTEISALDEEMSTLSARKDSLQHNLDSLRADYAQLVRKTHYSQMQQSPLLFVLSAKSFNQIIRRVRYLREFATYRQQQVHRIEGVQAEIDLQNEMLQENKLGKEDALRIQKREQDKLTRDEKKQKSMLSELKKKEKDLLAQQKKQQKKADELNRKIEAAIQKDADQKKKLTKEQTLLAGGFEKNKGRLPWPVENGVVISSFGVHDHPTLEHVTVNNKGITIQTTAGSTARAVYEGEVSSVFQNGNTWAIIVQHGNYRTVYSNLVSVSVKIGDKVKAKQKLGVIYTDGDQDNRTTLDFQIRKDKEAVNPSLWLTR